MKEHRMFTTAPHPYKSAKKNSADQNQVGWRLHIVKPRQDERRRDRVVIDVSKALCGLRPKHGWSLDMFIDQMCARCERAAEKMKIEYE